MGLFSLRLQRTSLKQKLNLFEVAAYGPEAEAEVLGGYGPAMPNEASNKDNGVLFQHTPELHPLSPQSCSSLPSFEQLSSPAVPTPAAGCMMVTPLRVYSRRQPRTTARLEAPIKDVQEEVNHPTTSPLVSSELLAAGCGDALPLTAKLEDQRQVQHPGVVSRPLLPTTEDSAEENVRTTFLNSVVHQVAALLPVPTDNGKRTRAEPPGTTPRCSRRISGAGVEHQVGDLDRRSTKRAMRSLNIIGKDGSIDQQAHDEYKKIISEPLSASHLEAAAALFGWFTLQNGAEEEGNVFLTQQV
jgi:hypothetical protein